MTDDALEARLFDRAGVKQGVRRYPKPVWTDLVVHVEMNRPGVTFLIVREEYRAVLSRRLRLQAGLAGFLAGLSGCSHRQ